MTFKVDGLGFPDTFAKVADYASFLPLGGAQAVGNNSYGQLGLNTLTNYISPITVSVSYNWSDVSILKSGVGTGYINENNNFYATGINDLRRVPGSLKAGESWISVTGGATDGKAVRGDNTLWVWGNNSYGQLGLSGTTIRSSAVQVGNLSNWSKVESNFFSTFAIKTDGTLWSMGSNANAVLGQMKFDTAVSSPVQVAYAINTWRDVRASNSSLYAILLKHDGTIWSCGYNNKGELGLSDRTNRYTPVQIGTDTNWQSLLLGSNDRGHQNRRNIMDVGMEPIFPIRNW
jgi:alpha-tubulin suppressor-like RCC1 family protein